MYSRTQTRKPIQNTLLFLVFCHTIFAKYQTRFFDKQRQNKQQHFIIIYFLPAQRQQRKTYRYWKRHTCTLVQAHCDLCGCYWLPYIYIFGRRGCPPQLIRLCLFSWSIAFVTISSVFVSANATIAFHTNFERYAASEEDNQQHNCDWKNFMASIVRRHSLTCNELPVLRYNINFCRSHLIARQW